MAVRCAWSMPGTSPRPAATTLYKGSQDNRVRCPHPQDTGPLHRQPPPAWAHAAAPGSLPHRELSKASTSTLEHTVPQQSGNRRGLPGPGKEAFQLPAAQPTASWRGRPHPLLAPYPQNDGRCGGMQPRSGSEAGGCSPRARVSEEKESPWPGQRGSQETGGRTGHEKQGGGSSEVEGVAGGCSEVDGTPDSGTLR